MKKNFVCIFFVTVFILLQPQLLAQTKTATKNQISISVSGIEFDDAGYAALKEAIKKNVKAQDLKQGYAQNTAKLSLLYPGEATELWDELPAVAKQPFKVVTIGNNNIELKLKNAVTAVSEPAKTTTNVVTDDCKNCYFNLCKYDFYKTFQGVLYKGINYDNGTYYYNCDNGIVTRKIITVNGYGVTTGISTDTILMSNAPVGTTWGKYENNVNAFGLQSSEVQKYTLAAKGLALTVNGNAYKDVIIVNYLNSSKSNIFGDGDTSINYYYAKGVGLIKTEGFSPGKEPAGLSVAKTYTYVSKPSIDPSIAGLWKYQNGQTITYWQLNADGTYDYYTGSMTAANKSKVKCNWWMDEVIFVTLCEGDRFQNRYNLVKKNDAATGKPLLIINGYIYMNMDNKASWK